MYRRQARPDVTVSEIVCHVTIGEAELMVKRVEDEDGDQDGVLALRIQCQIQL